MYMLMYVSRDVDQASAMLDTWVKTGVTGVTILESAGISQIMGGGIRADVGIVFSLKSLLRGQEIHHRTLLSAIKDEETLNRVVEASTKQVGDWTHADVGVLFVWPLMQAYGLDKKLNR
ncbi:MAG: hypothetical protein K8J31_08775 [Anaerolineae bacterium]|nr:hypothetical protein [Anaerolineae bacterium]